MKWVLKTLLWKKLTLRTFNTHQTKSAVFTFSEYATMSYFKVGNFIFCTCMCGGALMRPSFSKKSAISFLGWASTWKRIIYAHSLKLGSGKVFKGVWRFSRGLQVGNQAQPSNLKSMPNSVCTGFSPAMRMDSSRQMKPHNLNVSFKSASLYRGFRLILAYPNIL